MKNISKTNTLNERIAVLEIEQQVGLKALIEHFHYTYESLKPINLIKSTFHEVSTSPEIKHKLLNEVIGLSIGFFSKKLIVGASQNLIRKNIGSLLQIAIALVVAKYSDTIIATGENFLQHILKNSIQIKHKYSRNNIN